MIDLAHRRINEACPRHANRRIIAIDLNANTWRCAPNSMPPDAIPMATKLGGVFEHNAGADKD